MKNDEAREIFEKMEVGAETPERLATLQLLKEYFCNPEFRRVFQELSFQATKGEPLTDES